MSNSFGLIESKGLVALVEAADVILKNSPVEILGVHKLNNGLTALAVSGDQDYVNAAVESAVEAGKRVGEINAFTVIDQPPKQVVKIFGDLFLVSMENNDLISDSNDELNLKANRVSAPEFEKAKIGNNKVQVIKRREISKISVKAAHSDKKAKKISSGKIIQEKPEVKDNLQSSENIFLHNESESNGHKNDLNLSTIERLRKEALGVAAKKVFNENTTTLAPVKKIKVKNDSLRLENQIVDFELIDTLNVHKLRNYARRFPEFPIKGREISRANRDELMEYFNKIDTLR
ncbi:MAG: BMC domain-containing protein [Ignavibacterium sp.]|jgi:microcompartment protein CcmL/EutN|nr:BMC domain-containing protein [Ignavibacterium sp.]